MARGRRGGLGISPRNLYLSPDDGGRDVARQGRADTLAPLHRCAIMRACALAVGGRAWLPSLSYSSVLVISSRTQGMMHRASIHTSLAAALLLSASQGLW